MPRKRSARDEADSSKPRQLRKRLRKAEDQLADAVQKRDRAQARVEALSIIADEIRAQLADAEKAAEEPAAAPEAPAKAPRRARKTGGRHGGQDDGPVDASTDVSAEHAAERVPAPRARSSRRKASPGTAPATAHPADTAG